MPNASLGNNWMLLSSIRSNLSGQAEMQVFASKEKPIKNELNLDAPQVYTQADNEMSTRACLNIAYHRS